MHRGLLGLGYLLGPMLVWATPLAMQRGRRATPVATHWAMRAYATCHVALLFGIYVSGKHGCGSLGWFRVVIGPCTDGVLTAGVVTTLAVLQATTHAVLGQWLAGTLDPTSGRVVDAQVETVPYASSHGESVSVALLPLEPSQQQSAAGEEPYRLQLSQRQQVMIRNALRTCKEAAGTLVAHAGAIPSWLVLSSVFEVGSTRASVAKLCNRCESDQIVYNKLHSGLRCRSPSSWVAGGHRSSALLACGWAGRRLPGILRSIARAPQRLPVYQA
jgi:hypothetical protein